MTKQLNIRSNRAHELAVDMSRRFGKPLAQVVEDALVAYDRSIDAEEAELWGPLLKAAQAEARAFPSDLKIEDFYDPETGLPC